MNVSKQPTSIANHSGDDEDATKPVLTGAMDYAAAHRIDLHSHYRGQLLYAISGVMTVTTHQGAWVLPPQQALWLPPELAHEVRSDVPLAMRSLYIHPQHTRALPTECCVVNVPALLRELIIELVRLGDEAVLTDAGRRMVEVLLDQLTGLLPAPLHLPLPEDTRVRALAIMLLENPADSRSLDTLSRAVGASERTVARKFRLQTGMSFGAWRRQMRLLAAIPRLGQGEPVGRIAYDLGYQSPSAFVAMFKRVLGAPPGRYLRTGAPQSKNDYSD